MLTAGSVGSEKIVRVPAPMQKFPETTFKIANSLPSHPLFERERLKQLLRTMPRDKIEIRAVQVRDANDGTYKRGPMMKDADPIDTFERLDEKPAWMLLHDMWLIDPDFGSLLRDYIAELRGSFDEMNGELTDLGCWLFLSSGRCVVHFHADPDQSFLNQVVGSKTVYVYPAKILPESAFENLVYTGDQGAVTYHPEYERHMYEPQHISPGESVFLPLFAPHRVTNDDGLSVSWNVGFHTPHSRRRRAVHLVNAELRYLGLRPRPFNRSPMIDSFKQRAHLAFRVKNRLFKSLRPRITV